MFHVLILALMASLKSQLLNVLLVLLNALLVKEVPETVPHASMDLSQSMVAALFNVEKTSSASKDSVLLVLRAATVVLSTLKTVSPVPVDMSRLDPSARKDASLISSSKLTKRNASTVDLDVPLALPTTTAPVARTLPSLPEEESAPAALTHAPLVMEPELALAASQVSSTSKVPAELHVPMEPDQSTEFASVNQVLCLSVSV